MRLVELTSHLDEYLRTSEIHDDSWNGLQVEAGEEVSKIGIAVDAALSTIQVAVRLECDLLLVHHGLFWGTQEPMTGAMGARVGACFTGGLSVYASHLPLDLHREVGNNAVLCRVLGAEVTSGFGDYHGVEIGLRARLPEPASLSEVAGRLAAFGCDAPEVWSFGDEVVTELAVVSGGGCSLLDDAVRSGAQCFVTGEKKYNAYHAAREAKLSCVFGGHYRTEIGGVQALGEHIEARFGVETVWIEHPTGI